jgi:hypothetical protein
MTKNDGTKGCLLCLDNFVWLVEQKPSTKMIPGPENSVNHKIKQEEEGEQIEE